jgi:hypothetical protein
MEITKEQIERMVRSRMPFGIQSKRGKMLFPFKTVEMFEKTIDCLSNGIYEELSKLHQPTVSDALPNPEHCDSKPLCDDRFCLKGERCNYDTRQ